MDLEKEDSEAYKSNQAGSKSAVDEFIERERQKAESGPKFKVNNPIDPPEVKEASTANSSKKPDCKTTDQCPICCFNVDTGEEGVYCDECRTWNYRICLKLDQQEYIQLSKSDELFKCPTCDDRFIASLPDFQCNDGLCQAKLGELAGEEIREVIDNTYDEVVQWNSNLFKVPSGKAGRDFLDEMVKTINLFNCGSNLASVAITMSMIMPPLLLQKPAKSSKAKDHRMYLEKRLKLWTEGKISELVREGKVIQKRLSMNKKKRTDFQQIFVRLMLQGKVSAALRWIGTNRSTRMEVDEEVFQTLHQKHPAAASLSDNGKIKGPLQKVEDVLYESIDGKAIHLAAKRTQGSAGPTGMNSEGWARILCTKQLKSKPDELCDAIATFARKLCKEYVNPCLSLSL